MPFDYYIGAEADQFSFIRIPRALITEYPFTGLSMRAKLLYGLLVDKMNYSYRNQWIDKDNKVYIEYPLDEIQEDISVSKHTAIEALKELEQIGLIEKRHSGNGKPVRIYVKNYTAVIA